MFATTMKTREKKLQIDQEPYLRTYIPSPLLLALFLENGWSVVKIELAPSEDQLGLVYLATLKSDPRQQTQQLILPRNSLIEKILEENLSLTIPTKESQPFEEWLLTD
jgi:hypothetical protein